MPSYKSRLSNPSILLLVGLSILFVIYGNASAETSVWSQENWSQTVYYRSYFELDDAENGVIRITAVDSYELYFNGSRIGSDSDWTTVDEYPISAVKTSSRTKNNIAVKVTNSGNGDGNGLIVDVILEKTRITSTISKVANVWYWTAEPQAGTPGGRHDRCVAKLRGRQASIRRASP